MSSVPKTLGVIPPFVLQYDPTNQPVIQVAVYGGGLTEPTALRLCAERHRAGARGHSRRRERVAERRAERQINVVVDPSRASSLGVTSTEIGAAVAQANALLPSGRLVARELDANVYTNAVPAKIAPRSAMRS